MIGFSLFITKPENTNTCTISIFLYICVSVVCDFLQPCLNSVIKLRPQCLHLGERGVLLLCRFMSTAKGFKMLSDANFILNEVQKWEKVHQHLCHTINALQFRNSPSFYSMRSFSVISMSCTIYVKFKETVYDCMI